MRHSRHKNILKLISTDHRMIIEYCSSCYVSVQDIISDIVESLLPRLVFVHMEGIVHLSCEDPLAPGFYCVDRRL